MNRNEDPLSTVSAVLGMFQQDDKARKTLEALVTMAPGPGAFVDAAAKMGLLDGNLILVDQVWKAEQRRRERTAVPQRSSGPQRSSPSARSQWSTKTKGNRKRNKASRKARKKSR